MLRKIILLALLTLSFEVKAKDFGMRGKVFEIAERNMLEMIRAKLAFMKDSGEIDAKNQEMKDRLLSYLNRPKEVDWIRDAELEREYYYDPSYKLEKDLSDHEGNVFAKKGKVINPLEYMPLTGKLLFINGDNEKQVAWAVNKAKEEKIKIILIRGNLLDLMRSKKIRMYFDQGGVLSKKFGIEAAPAIIEQVDLRLLIKEMVIG